MRSEPLEQNESFPFDQEIVWRPSGSVIADSNLARFMGRWGIASYSDLLERSVTDIGWFWKAVFDDLNVAFYEPCEQIVDLSSGKALPRWCVGGKMNIVHNLLDKRLGTVEQDRIALRWESEDGSTRMLTYGELYREVCRCAGGLRRFGLGRGDVVGLYMPMIPELIIGFLAVIKNGGIVLPLFSGFGAGALVSRLNDAGTRGLLTANGYFRRGQVIRMKDTVDEALKEIPTLHSVFVVDRVLGLQNNLVSGRDWSWNDLVSGSSSEAETVRTDADDPLMIIYTSGTTGKPKGAVHTHCGFPVKAAQDMFQCMDLKPGETMYWVTDMGWMMGPWLVFGTLLIGSTMVIYDGAMDFPSPDRLWAIVERHGVNFLGISPSLIRALKTGGDEHVEKHDLRSLRCIGSTGSPWDPDSWMWTFKTVLRGEKPILNYSGGTEISGGIVCGNVISPLKPCSFSGPVPGMAADVVDENGHPVRGRVGELVIRQPWIGMTRSFWNDTERYLDTYWRTYEHTWKHGDFAAVDADGLWYILGRSDDTIKVSGKRIGPSEIESILIACEQVAEAAVIGVPHALKGEEIVAFVVPAPGVETGEPARRSILDVARRQLGKSLAPGVLQFVTALPKTRNAKVMHRILRAAYLDREPGDLSSLEDPGVYWSLRESLGYRNH